MTSPYYYYATSADLAALSRRKLQSVVPESGDTLRRSVLIHNIMRSTASAAAYNRNHPSTSSTQPITPPPSPTDLTEPSHSFDDMEADEEEEQAYQEASAFKPRATNEQDWLDSILNDLGASDYSQQQQQYGQVSVVDADDDDEEMVLENTSTSSSSSTPTSDCEPSIAAWHPPLFPTPSSLPTPTSPRFIPIPDFDDDCTFCTIDATGSPPTSPPGLEADDDMDFSDNEDDDDYHYGMMDSSEEELTTPSASTEFPQAVDVGLDQDFMLFSNLPFNRLRPVFCGHEPAPT